MVAAQYKKDAQKSRFLEIEEPVEEPTDQDFELDPTKVCLITDPDCESCQ